MTTSSDLQAAFALHRQGRTQDALTRYNRILADMPEQLEVLGASGLALYELGIFDTAIERFQRALRIEPSNARNWAQLAMVYETLGRYDDAIEALDQALHYEPDTAELWNGVAGVHIAAGHAEAAEAASRKATQLAPEDAATWFNLALSLQMLGRFEDALACATRANALAPDAAPPAGVKAQIEAEVGLTSTARATIASALARHPDVAALHIQAGEIESHDGHLTRAAEHYQSAHALDPNDATVVSELLFLRKRLADWRDLKPLRARFLSAVRAGRAVSPFGLLSDPSTRADQLACATRWSETFVYSGAAEAARTISDGTLRVGYLSADFHQHATAVLAAGLFESHDARGFRIIGYSTGPDDRSPMRARLEKAFNPFVDCRGWTAAQLASRIRADGVDILIDLKGHTDNARTDVLALRPAPIQASYLGYPGSMGALFIDYVIGDRVVTPFDHAADYSETIIQLPGSYQVNDSERPIIEPPSRAELGLAPAAMVFCGFNSAFKVNPDVLDAWSQILRETPGSILWLLEGADDAKTDAFAINIRRETAARGIDASRLVFASRRPYAEYLGLFRRADLFLDTWPYNAHTTASDALWAGCPVLTLMGDTFAGRVAASLLLAAGRPELIAPSLPHYVQQAIDLAVDRPALDRHRAFLLGEGRASPLFNTRMTTNALEAAYAEMAAQYRRGERAPRRIQLRPG